MIELKHITKTFRSGKTQVKAVRDVSLAIRDGEIYGIIGFSGAGKSTLVHCINLLERPTQGTVEVDGEELTGLTNAQLRRSAKRSARFPSILTFFPPERFLKISPIL